MRLNFQEEYPFLLFGVPPMLHPMVPVKLIGNRGLTADTYALLDSGSDVCMFHANWAKKIGLDLKSGRPETIKGIAPQPVKCYAHRIELVVGSNRVKCEVVFGSDLGEEMTDQLIGRDTVFDSMRFALRQKVGYLYIGSTP